MAGSELRSAPALNDACCTATPISASAISDHSSHARRNVARSSVTQMSTTAFDNTATKPYSQPVAKPSTSAFSDLSSVPAAW